MKNKSKGITLIALVITIVVLLILAGITIVTLTGENGLLNIAKISQVESDKANEKEQVDLAIMTEKINNDGAISKKILKEELDKIEGITGVPNETQEFPWIIIGKTGQEYKVDEKGINSGELEKEMWEIPIKVKLRVPSREIYSKTYILQHEPIKYIGELENVVLTQSPKAQLFLFRSCLSINLWGYDEKDFLPVYCEVDNLMSNEYEKGSTIILFDVLDDAPVYDIGFLMEIGFTLEE